MHVLYSRKDIDSRAVAAAKKRRGLINIHDYDCTMLHARIFECVADAAGTLTATTPSICVHMRLYRVAGCLIN